MKDPEFPSRRKFLTTGSALALGSALGAAGFAGAKSGTSKKIRDACKAPAPGNRPNFLFMMVDEMRYPPVYEADGLKQFRKQYLLTQEALRANGVEFHRHYAASTACAPSRTSIFTGHYPSLHGVTQTTGAAKEANDPDVYWLDPGSVPTMGDYFRAGGYRTFYKGKWHVSDADLQIPGTHDQFPSYDSQGNRDLAKEQLYLEANRLNGYGFDEWVGPEPHGKAPLNSGASAYNAKGRDQGFAAQAVELIQSLDAHPQSDPWLIVSSFVNPHDIALWGFITRALGGLFDFSVEDVVPGFTDLFQTDMFAQTLLDDLSTKPTCQASYQTSYSQWMQGVPPKDYFRLYYQLHKDVDEELFKVYEALRQSRYFDNTYVIFTSDHGDLLGSHSYMHQKWYQAYDEALRVPLIISNPTMFPAPAAINGLTSHVDLIPTMLGLAGLDPNDLIDEVSVGHSDALPLIGRNLSETVKGCAPDVTDPIYFMTDDDPSRGLDQNNFVGVAVNSVAEPGHIESVIVEIDGEIWKYSRYFDNEQFWSKPDPTIPPVRDVVISVDEGLDTPGTYPVNATKTVKIIPEAVQHEMYNVTQDPMELNNLADKLAYAGMQSNLSAMLDDQRAAKRLYPVSGDVPSHP